MAMMMERVADTDALLSGILKMGISEKTSERQTTFKAEPVINQQPQNYVRMTDTTASYNQMSPSNQKQMNGDQTFDLMNDFRSNGVETECDEMTKAAAITAASQASVNGHMRQESHLMAGQSTFDTKSMASMQSSTKANLEAYRRLLQPGLPRQLSYPDEVYLSNGQLKLKEDFYNMQSQSLNALDQQEGSPDMFFRSANLGMRPTLMNQWRMNQGYQQQQQQLNAANIPFVPRKYRLNIPKQRLCGFCKKNGEAVGWYTGHNLKEPNGKVLCPVLRAFQCPVCQATGDSAHTIKYCPTNEKAESFQSMLNMKYLRNSIGKRRGSEHNLSPPPSHNLSPTSPSFFPAQYLEMEKNAINWNNGGQWLPMDGSGSKIYTNMSANQPITIPRRPNLFQG